MLAIIVDDDIHLELLERRQAPALFALVDENRDHLRRWLPWVDSNTRVEHSRAYIEHTRRDLAAERGMVFGVWYAREHLSGTLGLHAINHTHHNLEIGYWLGVEWEGLGIMTRAVHAALDYAFHRLDIHRAVIRAATENERSRAIPERLGFTHEGRWRDAEWLYDHYVDHEIYSLLKHEYPQLDPRTPP